MKIIEIMILAGSCQGHSDPASKYKILGLLGGGGAT